MTYMSKSGKKKKLINITKITDKDATQILKDNNWNLNESIEYYYNNTHLYTQKKEVSKGGVKKMKKNLDAIFSEYANEEDDNMMTGEDENGLFKFVMDVGLNPEDADAFGLFHKIGAKSEMGLLMRNEFIDGFAELGLDTKEAIKRQCKVIKKNFHNKDIFDEFYRWMFNYIKERGPRKTIDKDVATSMWPLLLVKFPLAKPFAEWLEGNEEYKSVNRDTWEQTYEFVRDIDENLSNWEDNGAWPVVLDEFVEHYKKVLKGEKK